MYIERRIERHQLPYYLQVFNRHTGQPIGYLGNVSEHGLMLISQLPMLVGADFELQLKIPTASGGPQLLNITANCMWSREDETPGNYDSGFELTQSCAVYAELVEALRSYFTFSQLSASA
ncbi:PilZ domain-containing protein [Pseudomonas sp. HR96]|uniref:PilZ domain-containing protein n=1 Tax=Pseudomonas sp. HR96 TaxID=1027966 RepID=UPI002A766C9C|nr:PilZ domain-containing protein [Pseudomonas sp. HR96]WPO99131.1 PilZ domain-containing protein [Pseudomonas sp. HR96]